MPYSIGDHYLYWRLEAIWSNKNNENEVKAANSAGYWLYNLKTNAWIYRHKLLWIIPQQTKLIMIIII